MTQNDAMADHMYGQPPQPDRSENIEPRSSAPYCQDDIRRVCDDLFDNLVRKGFTQPNAYVVIEDAHNCFSSRLHLSYYIGDPSTGPRKSEMFEFDEDDMGQIDVEKSIKAAFDWIDGLASPDELRKQSFHEKLGKLIDEGREIGLDAMPEDSHEAIIMAKMREAMTELSENVLTDQRLAAE